MAIECFIESSENVDFIQIYELFSEFFLPFQKWFEKIHKFGWNQHSRQFDSQFYPL